jgi:hypothetical protein
MTTMIMSIGWEYVSQLRPLTDLLPRWCMSMENHGGTMMSTKENSWFFHQSSGNASSRDIWEQAGKTGERDENLAFRRISVHTCNWFLHAVKPSCTQNLSNVGTCLLWEVNYMLKLGSEVKRGLERVQAKVSHSLEFRYIYISVYLYTCPSVCLRFYLSVCQSTCLLSCLSCCN